jgi:hypothetical protein
VAYFDGRPTSEALTAICKGKGIRLDATLLRKMVDFELLTAPRQRLSALRAAVWQLDCLVFC